MLPVPLYDLAAERGLLGGLLIDPKRIHEADDLDPAAFYDDGHRAIFEAMRAHQRGDLFDALTVRAKLSDAGQLTVALAAKLTDIEAGALSAANLAHYVGIVAGKHMRRQVAELGARLQQLAAESETSPEALLAQAERDIHGIGRRSARSDFRPISEFINETLIETEEVRQGRKIPGVLTGVDCLDRATGGGFRPGELVVVAARPGVGKSSLSWQFAKDAAVAAAQNGGKRSAFVSLEMPGKQLAARAIAAGADMDVRHMRGGKLSDYDMQRLTAAAAQLYNLPIVIDDGGGQTFGEIRAKARRLRRSDGGLGLMVIDYLQLMTTDEKGENRNLEIATITREAKSLAKELEIPIFLLSQLSRDVEKAKRRPVLSDLRDSGGIEQDADAVVFIHLPDPEAKQGGADVPVELILAKQRNGPTGAFEATFVASQTRFVEPRWDGRAA